MIYTNGKILIHAENVVESLSYAIDELATFLQERNVFFHYIAEPFPHFLVPNGVSYQDLRECLGKRLEFRAINEATVTYPGKFEREVHHEFTPQELNEYADEMAELVKERDELEEEKKNFAAMINKKIANKDQRISELARMRRERAEKRNKDCRKVYDFDAGKIFYFTLEGNDLVDSEEMTPADRKLQIVSARQLPLFTAPRRPGQSFTDGTGLALARSAGPPVSH